jgi:NADH dehydrogenase
MSNLGSEPPGAPPPVNDNATASLAATEAASAEPASHGAARSKIVIVGAGFGGLQAARALMHAKVDITLIDRGYFHLLQPLLYQVATAALSPADVAWPIRGILRTQQNARVIMARVTGIDVQARCVHTTEIDLDYDYLVLATGATHSYFGHDDWAPYAPGLKHIADATEIRRRFLIAFERAEVVNDDAERQRLLTFGIIGGGATGPGREQAREQAFHCGTLNT